MLIFNLQEPGSLAALSIPAVMVTCWVWDKVAPSSELLRKRREAKSLKLQAQVRELWETREGALDWLVLQGHTRASAAREYARVRAGKSPEGLGTRPAEK